MTMFLVHILSVPAIIYQMETLVGECIQTLQSHTILQRTLEILETEQSMKIIINSMKGTQSLALLANVIHLFYLEPVELAQELGFPKFTVGFPIYFGVCVSGGDDGVNVPFTLQFVCKKLLESIPSSVGPKGGAFSQWHELLGWFSPSPDAPLNENLTLIKKQLYLLWSHRTVKLLLGESLPLSSFFFFVANV